MNKLLSIVMANYNGEHYIENAIRSVTSQMDDRTELIVCDASSSDRSVEIIRKYSDKIAWWCSETDGGQSEAFNKGFSYAKGKYLTWLNSDDILLPGAIEKLVGYLEANPRCRWLTGGMLFINENSSITGGAVLFGKLVNRVFRVPMWMTVAAPSSIFDADLFRQVGGFDASLHYVMDIDLWMRMERTGARLEYLQQYIWGFRVHSKSKTSSAITEGIRNEKFAIERSEIRAKFAVSPTMEKLQILAKRMYSVVSCAIIRRWCYLKFTAGTRIV